MQKVDRRGALGGRGTGAQAATLDVVRQRGAVTCGTTTGFAGFSAPDAQGKWQGLDVDLCRAVAAAVFGDADKIKVVPLNSQQRFTALQSGEVDVLTRNTTVTQQRDTALGIIHAGINFYDGQGFLVPKSLGVKSAKDINGATICLQTGTSNENTLADWARANHVTYKPVVIETFNEVVNAFAAAVATCSPPTPRAWPRSASPSCRTRTTMWCCPRSSPRNRWAFVRQGDDAWLNIVRWSLSAMIEAEEYGITSKNVDDLARTAPTPTSSASSASPPAAAPTWGWTKNGPTRSSSRWAITAKLRTPRRPGQPAENPARPERAMDARRPHVRTADPLAPTANPQDKKRPHAKHEAVFDLMFATTKPGNAQVEPSLRKPPAPHHRGSTDPAPPVRSCAPGEARTASGLNTL